MLRTFFASLLMAALLFVVAVPVLAADPACDPNVVGPAAANSQYCQGKAAKEPADIVANVATVVSTIGGIVAVLTVMFGGFLYITSNGDSSKAAKGRNVIIYSLVGLVIVVVAPLIVSFVVTRL